MRPSPSLVPVGAVRDWLPSGLFGSDKVRVDSKNYDNEQFIWESAAGVSFTVQNDTEVVHRGSQARHEEHLLLEEVQSEFLEERRWKDLEKKLLEFIGFPIELHVEKSKEKEVTDSGKNEDDNRGG